MTSLKKNLNKSNNYSNSNKNNNNYNKNNSNYNNNYNNDNNYNFIKLEGIDYLTNFYRSKLYDKENYFYLITVDDGNFIFLNSSAFKQLKKGKIIDKDLFKALLNKGIIITPNNIDKVIKKTRTRYKFLSNGTSLHIVIPTHRCNLACTYCFASAKKIDDDINENDLDEKTALKIIEFIMNSPSKAITIEFQGGEAIVRFDLVKKMVLRAKELNLIKQKDLRLTIVSNFTLMNDEIVNWLIDNDVSLCTSLDGPEIVHDTNRFILGRNGIKNPTYKRVVYWIEKINKIYDKKKPGTRVGVLPTISKFSLNYYKEIIDEFIRLEVNVMDFRPLTYVGRANNEEKILYSHKEFSEYYINSIKYLDELSKKGIIIEDRMRKLYETKILENTPGYHADFESPCGAATGQITYHSNGKIYTCNEALGREEFEIGDVFKDSWSDLFKKKETQKGILNSMIENNVKCDRCVFKPYCGTCMVENYYHFGKFNFYPTKTQRHYTTIEQSKLIFDPILKEIKKKIKK